MGSRTNTNQGRGISPKAKMIRLKRRLEQLPALSEEKGKLLAQLRLASRTRGKKNGRPKLRTGHKCAFCKNGGHRRGGFVERTEKGIGYRA